jgi:hypothetical protein
MFTYQSSEKRGQLTVNVAPGRNRRPYSVCVAAVGSVLLLLLLRAEIGVAAKPKKIMCIPVNVHLSFAVVYSDYYSSSIDEPIVLHVSSYLSVEPKKNARMYNEMIHVQQ